MTRERGTSVAAADSSPGRAGRPTFTVVIPLYQKGHRIIECLDSVRAQTWAPEEVIVIDDGSTDGGGEIARGYPEQWLRYVRQENQGVSVARNLGVQLASGDYIAFLDADDSWLPGHLAALADLAERYPRANLVSTAWSENGRPVQDGCLLPEQVIGQELFLRRAAAGLPPLWTSALAVRREAVGTAELFPVGSRLAEDQDAWLTLLQDGYGVRGGEVSADYYSDSTSPTVGRPQPADFDSVIFTKWSQGGIDRPAGYWAFVAAHRLYTIDRHIGHASNAELMKRLLQTRSLSHLPDRLRIAARIGRNQVAKWLGRGAVVAA